MILNDTDPSGQIAWLESNLAQISSRNGKVYAIGHIPQSDAGCLYNYSTRVGAIIRKYATLGVIQGTFFGHTHEDDFHMWKEGSWNGSKPVAVAWVTPSVTPFTYLNPSFRVFEYDSSTLEVLDYHQYHLDLNKTNESGIAKWELYYSAKSAYGLKDMSPASWENLINVFRNDDALFQLWNQRHYAGYWGTGPCTGGCKSDTLCAFESSTFKDMFECTGKEYNLSNLWPYIMNHIA